MQYSSEFAIRIKDKKLKEKVNEILKECDRYNSCDWTTDTDYVYSFDEMDSNELKTFLLNLDSKLKKDAIIIGSSTNYSVDDNIYCIYIIDRKLVEIYNCAGYENEFIEDDEFEDELHEAQWSSSWPEVRNIEKWLNHAAIFREPTKKQKETLKLFGTILECMNEQEDSTSDILLPNKDYIFPYYKKDFGSKIKVNKNLKKILRMILVCEDEKTLQQACEYFIGCFNKNTITEFEIDDNVLYIILSNYEESIYSIQEMFQDLGWNYNLNGKFYAISDAFDIIWFNDRGYTEEGLAMLYYGKSYNSDGRDHEDDYYMLESWDGSDYGASKKRIFNNIEKNISDLNAYLRMYFPRKKVKLELLEFNEDIIKNNKTETYVDVKFEDSEQNYIYIAPKNRILNKGDKIKISSYGKIKSVEVTKGNYETKVKTDYYYRELQIIDE